MSLKRFLGGLVAVLLFTLILPKAYGDFPSSFVVTGGGRGNAIAVDANNVHVAWYDPGDGISIPAAVRYVTFPIGSLICPSLPCGFSGFPIQTVASLGVTGNVAFHLSIAADAAGNPHIVYVDASKGLQYASLSTGTGWVIETVPIGVGLFNALALDTNGNPHIVTEANFGAYATKFNGSWVAEQTFAATGRPVMAASIVVDSHLVPHVAFANQTIGGGAVLYASRSQAQPGGEWRIGDEFDVDNSMSNLLGLSLAIDQNDNQGIAYWGWTSEFTAQLNYATRVTPTFWQPEAVEFMNTPCCISSAFGDNMVSLRFSPLGTPRISYGSLDAATFGTKIAHKDSAGWHIQLLDSNVSAAFAFTSIAVDKHDTSHVVHRTASAAPGGGVATFYNRLSTASGDLNGDGVVDCQDVAIVKDSFGKSAGQAGFDPRADVNFDGVVNILDLVIVERQLTPGTHCP